MKLDHENLGSQHPLVNNDNFIEMSAFDRSHTETRDTHVPYPDETRP